MYIWLTVFYDQNKKKQSTVPELKRNETWDKKDECQNVNMVEENMKYFCEILLKIFSSVVHPITAFQCNFKVYF